MKIKVIPRAKKVGIEEQGDFLIVRVSAPAREGQANKMALKMLAQHLKTKKIEIVSGAKSRYKTIVVKE
jgi:uncharacterized protein (TIGR00251 family)